MEGYLKLFLVGTPNSLPFGITIRPMIKKDSISDEATLVGSPKGITNFNFLNLTDKIQVLEAPGIIVLDSFALITR